MLCLTVQDGDIITCGDVTVVVKVKGRRVRLRVGAPKETAITHDRTRELTPAIVIRRAPSDERKVVGGTSK